MQKQIDITCKYCGGVQGNVVDGKGPHAYEVKCAACSRHNKWASIYDVREFTLYELVALEKGHRQAASDAHMKGDYGKGISEEKKADKVRMIISKKNLH